MEKFVSFDNNVVAHPEHWNKYPTMEVVESDYAFEMHIELCDHGNWLYNTKTGKVLVKLNSPLNIKLSYKPIHDETNLILRAMLLFTNSEDMHLQVKRCAKHRVLNNNDGVPPEHLLKCCHPDTQYVGNENATLFGQRLSTVVPLGRPTINEDGIASENVLLEFLCRNSCKTGINRRSTAVVFTLENELREIIGKSVMPFKVCKCPEHDIAREDVCRKQESTSIPYGKRPSYLAEIKPPKSENTSNTPNTSNPNPSPSHPKQYTAKLTMPSKQSMKLVLRCAFNELSSMTLKDTLGNSEKFARNIKRIKSLIESPKSGDTSEEKSSYPKLYRVTLTMPTKQSMKHVLRCAFNEFGTIIFKDTASNSEAMNIKRKRRLMKACSNDGN